MNKKRQLKQTLEYESLILPAFILYLVFIIVPFINTFYFSVTNYNKYHINDFRFVGLKNYLQIVNIDMLKIALVNSIKYAILMTVFQSLIAIPLSVILNKKMKMTNFYRVAFFLPAMFSPLVMGFLWQVMMGPTGLINQFLTYIGMPAIAFLNSKNGLNSIIITQVWQWVGWAVVIYLANMQNISSDMIEAAKIDGASEFQIFKFITLPLLQPAVTVVLVSSLIGGLKVYDIVQAMTGGGPGYSTETILTAMIKVGFMQGNYALSAAFGIVFFAIVMVFTMVLLALLRKWERSIS